MGSSKNVVIALSAHGNAVAFLHRDRKFNRIVPPPDVPDRSSFREIVPLRSSRVKSEADKMAASAIGK
jgi:hypothetical protein